MHLIVAWLHRFHRNEGGQISFLAVAGAIVFIGFVGMVMNTDDVLADRVHIQEVADVAVVSTASWSARGLNVISFVNVLNSKLISAAILLNALADALPIIEQVGQTQLAIFQACSAAPFVGAVCAALAAVVRVQLAILRPLNQAVQRLADSLSRCNKGGALWKMMRVLQTAGSIVGKTFPGIGFLEGVAIARANGADLAIVLNGELISGKGVFLPVKEEEFPKFCPFVKNGGSGYKLQGYDCGTGPLELGQKRIKDTVLLPFVTLFSRPIFNGMVKSHSRRIGCQTNPEDDEPIKVTMRNLSECYKYRTSAKWAHAWSETDPLTISDLTEADFRPWKSKRRGSGGSNDGPSAADIDRQGSQINIERDPEEEDASKTFTPGRGWQYLNEREAFTFPPRDRWSCRSGTRGYPFYVPPADGFDEMEHGQLNCLPGIGATCRTITRYSSQFTWYSSEHVANGPKDVGGYFYRFVKEEIEPEEEGGDKRYKYGVETVSLTDAGTKNMSDSEFDQYLKEEQGVKDTEAGPGSNNCSKPKPIMLDRGNSDAERKSFTDRLRYIGAVYYNDENDPPFMSGFFDDPPKRYISYAQAEVYNHLAEDTFTQDWRVRLEHATLLESFLGSGPVNGTAIGSGLAGKTIGVVNNH